MRHINSLCSCAAFRVGSLALLVLWTTAAWAQPTVPGYFVEEYAQVSAPGQLSFDSTGMLFVGNLDSSGDVSIWRVDQNGVVVAYGPRLRDPDAVLVDERGVVSGRAGAVIVGGATSGGAPPPFGYLVAIDPDLSWRYLFDSPTTVFRNPSWLTFDRTGRFLFTDPRTGSQGFVFDGPPGVPSILYDYGSPYIALAVDSTNHLYTVDGTGRTIQIHDENGNLVDGSFATHTGVVSVLAFAPPGGGWEEALYGISAVTGELLRIDGAGQVTVMGTGFNQPQALAFGPHDGHLYISSFGDHKIYRVAEWRQWRSDQGGNDHYYKVVEAPDGISWTKANEEALRATAQSHLATIDSAEEDAFVAAILKDRLPEFGPVGAWLGAIQTAGAKAADEGWRWTTDEPWSYTNWPAGEPNDLPYDEIYLEGYPRYPDYDSLVWNDCCGGLPINEDRYLYVVETPTLAGHLPAVVTVKTTPYWKEIGKVDLAKTNALFVTVMSGGSIDPTTIDFSTFEVQDFPRSALRGIGYGDKNNDGMPDFSVWYRLDRALKLGCCDYDQAVSAATFDGVKVIGRLRFEAVGCAP